MLAHKQNFSSLLNALCVLLKAGEEQRQGHEVLSPGKLLAPGLVWAEAGQHLLLIISLLLPS